MFTIHTATGVYKVRMRAAYAHIRSERKLRQVLRHSVVAAQPLAYAEALEAKLDANQLLELDRIFGLFNYVARVG